MAGTARTVRRALLVALLAALALLGAAGSASAHAQLEGSDPASGAVIATAPTEVTLVFGEPVEPAGGSLQVFDDHLDRVDTGDLTVVDGEGNRVRVGLRDGLGPGTYTVSWRVTSIDTHPVTGTFTFSVGAPSAVSGAVPGADENGPGTAALLALTRGLGYVGLVLGPGVLLVALTLWPAGLQDRRVRRVLAVGAGVLAVTTVGGGLLQGVWGSGLPLRALWVTPAELDTHSRRFDTVFALRSYLVVGFGVALAAVLPAVPAPAEPAPRRSRRRPPVPARPGRGRVGGVVALSVALLGTWSAAGHAAVGPDSPLAVVSDVVHLAAMTVWLGGLVLLAVGLTSSGRAAELAVVVPRFSRLAQVAVTLLVATGVFQVWREVGSVAALTGTSFGRLLLVKLAGVGVLLLLGDVSRRWVLRHTAPARGLLAPRLLAHASGPGLAEREAPADPVPDAPAVRLLRRGLLGELAVAACVLGLTAVLVATVPARQAYVAPVEQTVEAAGLTVDVRVDAPRVGDTVVHLDVHRPDGTPVAVQQLTGAVSPPEPGAAPLPVRPLPPGPDAARPEAGLSFTGAGDWTLQLTVQTSALDATSLTVTVPVT